jgi:hypothetical protein
MLQIDHLNPLSKVLKLKPCCLKSACSPVLWTNKPHIPYIRLQPQSASIPAHTGNEWGPQSAKFPQRRLSDCWRRRRAVKGGGGCGGPPHAALTRGRRAEPRQEWLRWLSAGSILVTQPVSSGTLRHKTDSSGVSLSGGVSAVCHATAATPPHPARRPHPHLESECSHQS